jgi:hypothetical protein
MTYKMKKAVGLLPLKTSFGTVTLHFRKNYEKLTTECTREWRMKMWPTKTIKNEQG